MQQNTNVYLQMNVEQTNTNHSTMIIYYLLLLSFENGEKNVGMSQGPNGFRKFHKITRSHFGSIGQLK